MGKSSPDSFAMGGNPTQTSSTSPQHQSFGDKLGSYLMQRYPVAGAAEHALFSPGQSTTPAIPPVDMIHSQQQAPMSDMISMNAQPKKSGLMDLLKALL